MSTLFVSKYALAAMGGFYTMKVRSKDDIELVPDEKPKHRASPDFKVSRD